METILEQQRRSHEERERLVKTMVDENMMKKNSVKDQIYSDHRTKMMLDVSFPGILLIL
jgi:splicing factor 3A subunit 3